MAKAPLPKTFRDPNFRERPITELRTYPSAVQMNCMREWFFDNYEDPGLSTPRDDGDFIFIWGGPFDANDVLNCAFGAFASDEAIDDLSAELTLQNLEWAPVLKPPPHSEQKIAFRESMVKTGLLLNTPVNVGVEEHFVYMLYVSIITGLETYLADFVLGVVLSDDYYFRRFIENNEHFKERKIFLSEIFKTTYGLKAIVREYLRSVMWHDLAKVNQIYKATFDFELPKYSNIYRAVRVRHDLVHRSGKARDDDTNRHSLQRKDVHSLISEVVGFVEDLETEWARRQ